MNCIIVNILSVFFAVYAVGASITWNEESVTVRQGDSLNLTCTVSDVEFMDVIRISLKNTEGQILTIADNEAVKQPFSDIPRYKIDYHVLDQQGFVTVLYKDIRGEDMGTLQCNKLANKGVPAEIKLHVLVPVKEIYLRQKKFNQWKRLQEMETVTLREMESNELECVAVMDGGLTPTDLSISIGNEDKTQFFTAGEESKIHKNRDNDLGFYYSEFKLQYSSMNPLREFNGLTMTCVAVQEGFNNASTSALLRVEYTPVILCEKYEHHSKFGGSVNIVCEIDANPMSQSSIWMIQYLGQSEPIRLDLVNISSVHTSEMNLDDHRKQVRLTIDVVEQLHYASYHLSATNAVSTAEVTIVLLPASLELSQIPSAQDQMMLLLQQQHLPETSMVQSSSGNWILESLAVHKTLVLVSVILPLSWRI